MNCSALLSEFFDSNGISNESYNYSLSKVLKAGIPDSADIEFEDGEVLIRKILIDVYSLNSQNVKSCANIITKKYGAIGRSEKDLIKHFLDYSDEESLSALVNSLSSFNVAKDDLVLILHSVAEDLSSQAIDAFKSNWAAAESIGDKTKKFDYIQGIYTRLVNMLNDDSLSLRFIIF